MSEVDWSRQHAIKGTLNVRHESSTESCFE
jgi:hypothetical protein